MRGRKELSWVLGLPLLACTGVTPGGSPGSPPPAGQGPAEGTTVRVTPARFVPVGERNEPRYRAEESDGRARVVEGALRFIEHPDGRLDLARDPLPDGGFLGVVSLPPRLGGGYLFWVRAERVTDVFRASGFTEKLEPLLRLPFEVAEVVSGFDRVLVVSAQTRAVLGVDPITGQVLAPDPLPPAAAYGAMAFAGSWMGAVFVDLRGVLATFDAGATWHPVGSPLSTTGVSQDGDRILLSTARGVFSLGASGELERFEPVPGAVLGPSLSLAGDDESSEEDMADVPGFRPPRGPLGAPPLEVAALRGLPDTPTTAVVAANGVLARVHLSDGRLMEQRRGAFPAGATCQAVRLGAGLGFVCGEDRGRTVVHALDAGFELQPVLEFGEPRRILSSGNGALVAAGGCPGAPLDVRTYCVMPRVGARWELRIQGDSGVERVVALHDGRVAVVAPPRLGLGGTLTVLGREGVAASQALSLARVPEQVGPLVSGGTWTDAMIEVEPGVLGGWVVASSSFVGVRVGLDGVVRVGSVRRDASRTSFSGRHAFSLGEQGDAHESTDGGMVWAEVSLPDRELGSAVPEGERGCTEVGCGLGGWARIGWGEPDAAPGVPTPPRAALDPAPIITWALQCSPTGVTSAPPRVLPPSPRAPGARSARPPSGPDALGASPLESSAFRPFLGVPAPPLRDALGFDFGTESHVVQLRGYVWGDRGARWDRTGSWLVRVADRFRVRESIWSTAVSRPPWPDATAAAEVFAADPSRRASNEWGALQDPSGDGGLLFVKTGTTTELFVMEDGRPLVPVQNAADFSLDQPAGAVKTLGRWFFASLSASKVLQLRSIDEGRIRGLASYPRANDSSPARVVRSSNGDAVGIWVIQSGHQGQRGGGDSWLVHPADPKSGALGPPLVIPRSQLTSTPRPCDADDEGWVLGFEIGPAKGRVDFVGVSEAPAVEHLEARLLATERGVCVDALAARVDGGPPGTLRPTGGTFASTRALALALTDRATDRRWEFRCIP